MRLGREEQVTLFRAWLDDAALLRVELRFKVLAATFRARITCAEEAELRFMSDDSNSELVLPVPPDAEFRYLDMRDYPEEAKEFVRMVVMFFPYDNDPGAADQLVFAEVIEGLDNAKT